MLEITHKKFRLEEQNIILFLKWANPLFQLFSIFYKQTIQFLQQINVKKCQVHPVYGTGIRTHDLLNTSRLP